MTAALLMQNDDFDSAPKHVAERMAEVIAGQLQQGRSCGIEDLVVLDFSIRDISRYWAEANKLAAAKRPRRL